jgi:hypothetical protein
MAIGLSPALSVDPARTDRQLAPNAFPSERGGRSFCVVEIVGVTFPAPVGSAAGSPFLRTFEVATRFSV